MTYDMIGCKKVADVSYGTGQQVISHNNELRSRVQHADANHTSLLMNFQISVSWLGVVQQHIPKE